MMTSQEENKDTPGSVEEQMKQQLTEGGFYEEGMSLIEMKDMINALDESKKNVEENSVHQIIQPRTPSVSPPIERSVNVSPPGTPNENNSEGPKKSYLNAAKSSKSPSGNVAHQRRESTEGNSASETNNRTSPKKYIPTAKPHLTECEKKQLRIKKMTMDPLKAIINENDKPLRQPERSLVIESEPFSFCNDLKNSKFTPKELVQKVSVYLQEVRDEWIAHTMPKADESEYQWGSPIKVGSHNFNLDKKSVTRSEPDVVEPVRESRSRASKRKAASLIASFNNVSDSDLEPDDESALLKKRKSQQEGRTTTAGGSDVQMDVDYEHEPSEMPSTSSFSFTKETKIQLSEDEEIFEPRAKSKSPETFQPRRIIPPNPGTNKAKRGRGRGGKTSFKGPRAKKSTGIVNKTPNTEASTAKSSSPQEIVLDNDDVEFDDLSKPINMKALKLSLKEKTKLAQQKLVDAKNQEKQRIDQKKFYDNMFEETKEKEREALRRKRLEEEEKTKKSAKEKEETEKEKKKVWNNFLNNSVKQKREKPKGLSEEQIRRRLEEDEVVVCDDQPGVHNTDSTSENRVPCPICNKHYPESEIENHASGCNQFEFTEEDTSSPIIGSRQRRNNLYKQKCNICKDYVAHNANDYMEHVQICIEQDQKRKDST